MDENPQKQTTLFPLVITFFILIAFLAIVQGASALLPVRPDDLDSKWVAILAGTIGGTAASYYFYRKYLAVRARLSREIADRQQSEERLGLLAHALESITEAVSITDMQERFTFVNRAFEELYGYSSSELIGKSLDLVRSPRTTDEITRTISPSSLKGEWHGELWNKKKDGTEFIIALASTSVRDERGKIIAMVGAASDVTQYKIEEERLRKNELALDRSGEAILITDEQARIEYVNPAFEKLYGYPATTILGTNPRFLKSGQMPPEVYVKFWETVVRKEVFSGEFVNRTRNGNFITVEATINPILNKAGKIIGYLGIQRDISERKQTARQLQSSLAEKETLLRELHHRVKNNLSIVASMAGLQASMIADLGQRQAFEEMRERVVAMARMHDVLFKACNSLQIDLSDFIRNLTIQLSRAYERENVAFVQDIESVELDSDAAIPCGMIINELISNALKYAFAEKQHGTITVRMKNIEGDRVELTVADDGIGFHPETSPARSDSLGMTIVSALVEQLHGTMEIASEHGTSFTLVFPVHRDK
jgi:PAS domain S-box-containing protein